MPDVEASRSSTWSLVRVPAVITLAVTLVRLAGELLDGPQWLFGRAAGGGGALVGISWLVPLFGLYFGAKLGRSGAGPAGLGRGIGLVLISIALLPAAGFAAGALGLPEQSLWMLVVFVVASLPAVWLGLRAWPALGRTLLAYAFAARVPVALVMLVAMFGNWGTHYDVPPPDFPAMGPFAKWLWIGLLPQMSIWIAYTVCIGALFGLVAGKLAARGRQGAIA